MPSFQSPTVFASLAALCLALPAAAQVPVAPAPPTQVPVAPAPTHEEPVTPMVANAQVSAPTDSAPRWPVAFETDSGTLVIYLPQLESFANNQIAARAAFSYAKADSAPKFGTFWFTARVDVDRDANLVTARSLAVTRVRFPNVTVAQQEQFEAFVRHRLEESELSTSVDRIVALVAATQLERTTAQDIKSEPPRIIVMSRPTVLLLYDGEPTLRPITGTHYQRVVNTALAVAKDTTTGLFYLAGGGFWYNAHSAMGPWDATDSVPDSLRAMVPDTMDFDKPDGPPPQIIAQKDPTELIVTDGPMHFQAVEGTDLRYVSNTESDILKEGSTFYVLLSGRWYAAAEMTGPWRHIRPDSLPASFAKIYPSSVVGDVLAFVPGTPQADEAVADAMIPQTTAVNRAGTTLTVEYDGEPDFELIPGTQVEWAYNTQIPVMKIGGLYYACDNAVWFLSPSAKGPWTVSDSVPQAVQTIPANNPIYNVKYVQVYQSTPEVVYVGYTPGYVGMYPYYGTVVYGTGWPYPPYMGAVYYPRPVTYGFAFHYNPYSGWGVGVAVGGPFLRVGVAFRPPYPAYRAGGMYGAAGYRPANGNVGVRPGTGARPGARPTNGNIYNRPGNSARNAPRASTQPARRPTTGAGGARPSTGMGAGGRGAAGGARPSTGMGAGGRPNNVFAAPNGNVMRQQGGNWQQAGANGGWGAAGRGSSSTMNRDAQARSRGASREASRPSYGGGGGRGGGGRGGGGGGRRR